MSDLDAASLEDIEQFFTTYYTPDNAVLSIAGDFDRAEARRLVERHFGPIPRGAGKPPLPDMTLPPTLGGPLREVVPDDVVLPRLFLAFRSPVFGSDDCYSASVCGAILGLKKGSRLHRRLVREKQVAAEAQSFTYDLTKGSDLLVLDVTARPETTFEELERAVHEEVDRLREEGVTADEVARAVTLIETEMIVALQSAGDRADKLSLFATYFGDPALVNGQAARYREVTPERVNAFARARLGTDNRASLLYVPRGAEASLANRELAEAGVR
jgi:predicted Zn-dependent peptidase